ncbi:DsbA family protein [Alisedimentitalea sp. MJ-SS2]|uniref:DsbA family protein n=1 Tax=Aliisedimentitalea sp. MJ-SS2 TaxID=3049795 RepID=UPI0029104DD9|nr:DsbA family protein [Alisedimentitalea sp. MJ-SS2]MDU8926446.1 DsbA family protein [Alisedimentitalea sp. MJ-SS2]
MKRHFAAALALGLAFAGPAQSFDLNDMTDAERAAFRAEIRAYLLDNPEVIMEAVAVLEQRDAAQQAIDDKTLVAAHGQALFNDPDSWAGGNLNGDITMVEFVDYRCGYCRKAHDEVAALISQDGNIRIIVKEFPILGEDSVRSSQFAIAVRQIAGDDAYKSASEALIKLKGKPETPVLHRLANTLGLDADEVIARMDSDEVNMVITANRSLGQQMQINGTPTFVIGDQLLRGYLPLASMQGLVADVRNQ